MKRRIAATLALAVSAGMLAVAPAEARLDFFQSPSGNVHCAISGEFARCDIREREWSPPPRPPSCELDYGQGVAVERRGKAKYVCASDTVVSPDSSVLRYGESISRGRFRCVSKESKVKCLNERSGRGFKLSRARVKLF